MDPRWKWFLPGYVWSLPITLVGIILMPFYRPHSFEFSGGVLRCISEHILFRPGAQTFGIIQYYRSEDALRNDGLRVHETGHTWQAFIGGIFFGAAYLLCFGGLYAWMLSSGKLKSWKDWRPPYERNPFERFCERIRDNRPAWS